jgi:hypothetical protein
VDSKPWLVAVTVAAVLVVGVGLVAITGRGHSAPQQAPPTTVISDAMVDRFLEDFEESLTATYSATSTFERLKGEKTVLRDNLRVVQRGLDRLTFRDGSVSGRLDGRVVTCTGKGDEVSCLAGENQIDVAAEISDQVGAVRGYVDGPELLYGVSAIDPQDVRRIGGETDRCYTLELIRQLPVAPYGTLARFCFDAATGAPTMLRVERPEGIDITAAVAVSGTVADTDLALPS